jgi:hypothetical protein
MEAKRAQSGVVACLDETAAERRGVKASRKPLRKRHFNRGERRRSRHRARNLLSDVQGVLAENDHAKMTAPEMSKAIPTTGKSPQLKMVATIGEG